MGKLTQLWLQELCETVQGVIRAVVFLYTEDKDFLSPDAIIPENTSDITGLQTFANIALSSGECVLLENIDSRTEAGEPLDVISCPLFLNEKLHGVAVVQTMSRSPAKRAVVLQQVENAVPWFGALKKQETLSDNQQLFDIVELVASSFEFEHCETAATRVMTEIANRLACDRVSIGFIDGNVVSVHAISHSGGFDRKSTLIRCIGESMFEAIDQDSPICYPQTDKDLLVTRCHKALNEEHKIGTILTLPFVVGDRVVGAMMAERSSDHPFEKRTQKKLELLSSMIGPALNVRYRDEQWLPVRISRALKSYTVKLFGPGYIALKTGALALVCCIFLFSLISANHNVTGDAKLEAQTQQVVVAPLDGYIAKANVRPGDIVNAGEVLGTLDDKDLQLEHQKWSSQLEQLQSEYRDALARHDRSKVSIVNARINKAKAQLKLVAEQLARTSLIAPFDGWIVSGDLTQVIGSPVERGQILFTIAPLLAYRVVLNIDERDIGWVEEGQQGSLVLTAMPRSPLPFILEKITPVSTIEDGRNYFLVEAKIRENLEMLRPGMEGAAKITIEKRKLLWIVSHNMIDWIRLKLWFLFP